jgi:SAM-dependent methyltransferase
MNNDLKEYYERCYADVANGGIGGAVQRLFHRVLERPFTKRDNFHDVLELGATNAEHLKFVKHGFRNYTMLDINDSATARAAAESATTADRNVSFVVGDAQVLDNLGNESFDRVISMCLLHHLSEPDEALRRWRAVVKPGGQISIFVPCDPGVIWRMGRWATTFRRASAHGYGDLEIRYLNALDHRNHVASLSAMVRAVFADDRVRVSWFPVRFMRSWNSNLFLTFQITRAADPKAADVSLSPAT